MVRELDPIAANDYIAYEEIYDIYNDEAKGSTIPSYVKIEDFTIGFYKLSESQMLIEFRHHIIELFYMYVIDTDYSEESIKNEIKSVIKILVNNLESFYTMYDEFGKLLK